jgi:3D (Asp-Asp-Asp) domain-containing protein
MENRKNTRIIMIMLSVIAGAWCFLAAASAAAWKGYKVEKELIPFDVKERKSGFIQKGWTVWLQEGEDGYKNRVMQLCSIGNKRLAGSLVFKTGVIKSPRQGIKISGISDKKHPITVPQETFMHEIHTVEATAYDSSPESNSVEWAGITSLGWRTRYGIAAVDPKVIALRRLIYVEGYGFAWTGDVGGAIKGKKIDLCYNTTEEAFRWGRKKVKVYVLGTKPLKPYRTINSAAQAAVK